MSRDPETLQHPALVIFQTRYTPAQYGDGGIAFALWATLHSGACPQHCPAPHYHLHRATVPICNNCLRYEDVQALPVPVLEALSEAIEAASPPEEEA